MSLFRLHQRSSRHRRLDPDASRFARGTRSVADLIAPAAMEVARDYLRLDQQYVRALVVTGLPRTVEPGWLAPLIDFEAPIELSLHIFPLETGPMLRTLSHKLVQLHSSRLLDARHGRLADPERETAYEDIERLRDALQRVGLQIEVMRADTRHQQFEDIRQQPGSQGSRHHARRHEPMCRVEHDDKHGDHQNADAVRERLAQAAELLEK